MTTNYPGPKVIFECIHNIFKGALLCINGNEVRTIDLIRYPSDVVVGVAAEDSIDGKVIVELNPNLTHEGLSLGSTSSSKSCSSSKSSSESIIPETIPKKKKLTRSSSVSEFETIPKKKDVKKIKDMIMRPPYYPIDSTSAEMILHVDSSSFETIDVINFKIRESPLAYVKKFYKSLVS